MKIINTTNAPAAIGPYSQGVVCNNLGSNYLYFFSGQIALTTDETICLDKNVEIQTKQILKNILALLNECNLKKENVAKTTIYLTNMDNFMKVNEIYAKFFGEHKPARSTIGVQALPKEALVEIEIICCGNPEK